MPVTKRRDTRTVGAFTPVERVFHETAPDIRKIRSGWTTALPMKMLLSMIFIAACLVMFGRPGPHDDLIPCILIVTICIKAIGAVAVWGRGALR